MSAHIVLGIGTTGLKIIEELQRQQYDFKGKNKPDNVQYLFIDTDNHTKTRSTPTGKNDIRSVPFNLGNILTDVNYLKSLVNQEDFAWIPEVEFINNNLTAASGNPVYGRLALWRKENFDRIKSAINEAHRALGNQTITKVHVVGTLTGGTGSGLSVDIAYLVRRLTRIEKVYGLFLLPGVNHTNRVYFENSLLALTSINYYGKAENTYKTIWPDGVDYEENKAPYEWSRIISPDFQSSGAPSINSVPELIKIAGTTLNLTIFNSDDVNDENFDDKTQQRRSDSLGANHIERNLTIGLKAFEYPKSQLLELFALESARKKLNELINSEQYYTSEGPKKIQTEINKINYNTQLQIEDIINSVFDEALNLGTGSKGIRGRIESIIDKLMKKDYDHENEQNFFLSQFDSDNEDNAYDFIKNNKSVFENDLIAGIENHVAKTINSYKSIAICEKAILAASSYLELLQNKYFEESYTGITRNNGWHTFISKYVNNVFSSISEYKNAGEKKRYLQAQSENIVRLAALHNVLLFFNDVMKGLDNPDNELKSNVGQVLPSLLKLKTIKAEIKSVIGGETEGSQQSILARINEIRESLNTNNSCFHTITFKGSLDEELDFIESEYNRKTDNKIDANSLLGTQDIWEYCNKRLNNTFQDVYINSISIINNLKLLDGKDLVSILRSEIDKKSGGEWAIFNSNIEEMRSHTPAMTLLKGNSYQFHADEYLKFTVVSNDTDNFGQIFNKERFTYNAGSENVVQMSSLDDILIFYQEYGFLGEGSEKQFDPLIHMHYMEMHKRYIIDKLEDANSPWFKTKLAYLNKEQLKEMLS